MLQAFRAGAHGFLFTSASADEFLQALTEATAARRHIPDDLATSQDQVDSLPAQKGLSCRELDVLKLVAVGFTDRQIATTLGIRGRTVTTHMAHIFAKLGVHSRIEAVNAVGAALDQRGRITCVNCSIKNA